MKKKNNARSFYTHSFLTKINRFSFIATQQSSKIAKSKKLMKNH